VTAKRTPKAPTVKMSLRLGMCSLYSTERAMTCPLCNTLVPAGEFHECHVDNSNGQTKKERT
jgi:hypothetical protein